MIDKKNIKHVLYELDSNNKTFVPVVAMTLRDINLLKGQLTAEAKKFNKPKEYVIGINNIPFDYKRK